MAFRHSAVEAIYGSELTGSCTSVLVGIFCSWSSSTSLLAKKKKRSAFPEDGRMGQMDGSGASVPVLEAVEGAAGQGCAGAHSDQSFYFCGFLLLFVSSHTT